MRLSVAEKQLSLHTSVDRVIDVFFDLVHCGAAVRRYSLACLHLQAFPGCQKQSLVLTLIATVITGENFYHLFLKPIWKPYVEHARTHAHAYTHARTHTHTHTHTHAHTHTHTHTHTQTHVWGIVCNAVSSGVRAVGEIWDGCFTISCFLSLSLATHDCWLLPSTVSLSVWTAA